MTEDVVKIALLFRWCPEVEGGQLIETSATPEVAMRLEYVELEGSWKIEGLDVGSLSYRLTGPDLRRLELPPVSPVIRVTIRARNGHDGKQRFPGAKIIGTVIP